jgi:hypothetical protein
LVQFAEFRIDVLAEAIFAAVFAPAVKDLVPL